MNKEVSVNFATKVNYNPRVKAVIPLSVGVGLVVLTRYIERGEFTYFGEAIDHAALTGVDQVVENALSTLPTMDIPDFIEGHTSSVVEPTVLNAIFQTVFGKEGTWRIIPRGQLPAHVNEFSQWSDRLRRFDPMDIMYQGIGAAVWVCIDASARYLHDYPEKVPILGHIDRAIYNICGIQRIRRAISSH